ncbi:hypothetical protein [Streptomyces chilikensis]|uniref:C3H1-type domain-containing protein n=1 Tax=Streptomyces chilikensis TaxID=1194079 RepID=A0ABV3ERF2_9ACTN
MTDLERRAAAIFGKGDAGILWPYDVSGIDHTLARTDPAAYAQKLAVLTTKRYTIVEWAEHHGLKKSSVKCCPLWLTRTTSRRCRWDSDCQRRIHPDRPWLDHHIYWLKDGKPAAITSAPYEISTKDQERLAWWRQQHRTLRVDQDEGWYGYDTTQIVMWNKAHISYVGPAKNIDRPETFLPRHD